MINRDYELIKLNRLLSKDKIRKCPGCYKVKSYSEYGSNSHKKTGITSKCKKCYNNIQNTRRNSQNTLRTKRNEHFADRGLKECSKCGIIKPLNAFVKNANSKDGLYPSCIDCRKIYYQQNREKLREYGKKYRKNNKEFVIKNKKTYRKNNKESLNKANRKRYASNPEYALKNNIRNIQDRIFQKTGLKRSKKTEQLIGISIDKAKEYILRMGYNRDIHDLDHVIPLSAFDLFNPDHVRVAAHYTNLRPENPEINRGIKRNKLLPDWENVIINIANNAEINPKNIIKYIKNKLKAGKIKFIPEMAQPHTPAAPISP